MERLNRSFEIENPQYDYPLLLKYLRDNGEKASPRGEPTRELFDVVMKLDPHMSIVEGINRKLSMKLISMEGLQLISSSSYPMRIVNSVPNMSSFLTGEFFHGAYGVRIGAQLGYAIKRLQSDRDSRQAVITIWDPVLDAFRFPQSRDVPCTTMLQFFIRNDKLVLHVTMRSNDVWWGTPHDWGQFSQLHLAMANVLNIEAGDYYHHAVSFHLYERDFDKIETLTEPTKTFTIHDGFGYPGISFEEIQERAMKFIEDPDNVVPLSVTENWHLKQQLAINGDNLER